MSRSGAAKTNGETPPSGAGLLPLGDLRLGASLTFRMLDRLCLGAALGVAFRLPSTGEHGLMVLLALLLGYVWCASLTLILQRSRHLARSLRRSVFVPLLLLGPWLIFRPAQTEAWISPLLWLIGIGAALISAELAIRQRSAPLKQNLRAAPVLTGVGITLLYECLRALGGLIVDRLSRRMHRATAFPANTDPEAAILIARWDTPGQLISAALGPALMLIFSAQNLAPGWFS